MEGAEPLAERGRAVGGREPLGGREVSRRHGRGREREGDGTPPRAACDRAPAAANHRPTTHSTSAHSTSVHPPWAHPPWEHRRERARRQRTRGSAGTSACQRSISHPLCRLNSASTARPCQKPVTRAVAGPPSTIVHIAPDGTARNGSLPSASARSSAPHARSGAGWPPRAG